MDPGALSVAAAQFTRNVVTLAWSTLAAPAKVGGVVSALVVPLTWTLLVPRLPAPSRARTTK